MSAGWEEEARGIEPWEGALLTNGYRCAYVAEREIGWHGNNGAVLADDPAEVGPDLSDPDTLAAFDRRLALRLGAPTDATSFAVELDSSGVLNVAAGFLAPLGRWTPTWRWGAGHDTHDPLLARVRAWKSVP